MEFDVGILMLKSILCSNGIVGSKVKNIVLICISADELDLVVRVMMEMIGIALNKFF